jgi:hypothetical protein
VQNQVIGDTAPPKKRQIFKQETMMRSLPDQWGAVFENGQAVIIKA